MLCISVHSLTTDCYMFCALVRGYTAPEYAMHGQLSEKADTYSYGIVVLEIVSGQKSTNVKEDEEGREYLLQRVSKVLCCWFSDDVFV